MPNSNVPSIPVPTPDPNMLALCVLRIKQGIDSLAGASQGTSSASAQAVVFADLVSLGLLTPAQLVALNSGSAKTLQGVSGIATTSSRKVTLTIGDGSNTTYTVTHGLNTRSVNVGVIQAVPPFASVQPTNVSFPTLNTVTFTFSSVPAASSLIVTVIG